MRAPEGTGSITSSFLQSVPLIMQKGVKSLIRKRGKNAEVRIDTVSRTIILMINLKKEIEKNSFKIIK